MKCFLFVSKVSRNSVIDRSLSMDQSSIYISWLTVMLCICYCLWFPFVCTCNQGVGGAWLPKYSNVSVHHLNLWRSVSFSSIWWLRKFAISRENSYLVKGCFVHSQLSLNRSNNVLNISIGQSCNQKALEADCVKLSYFLKLVASWI